MFNKSFYYDRHSMILIPSRVKVLRLVLPLILSFFLLSCTQSDQQKRENNENKTVKLTYANWAEGVALSNLAAVVLEDELGYNVITKMTPVSNVFDLVASGDYHFFADAWLPKTHRNYMEVHKNQIVKVGTIFQQAKTGLIVPDYVDISSIADLRNKVDAYNGKIIGIDPTAGIMKSTKMAIGSYNLDGFKLIESSGPVMADSLRNAIMRREPIVLTGWVPHWIWAEFNIRFLEDPKQVFGQEENIVAIANKSILEENKRAVTFFERFSLNRVQLSSLMSDIRTSDKLPTAVAREWVIDNPAIVNDWVHGLKPKRERVY